MKVRAPSNQKILGAIEGPELPLLGMVISFYFLIVFYWVIYWGRLIFSFFILIIHWDFVSEFFYFAFFGAFLLGLLYLNFLVGLFMDTSLLGLFPVWLLYWTYYQYCF